MKAPLPVHTDGAPPSGVRPFEVVALADGSATAASDWLADEVPVALIFNGISHAVMMATPADLEDFALGFSLTEGLLRDRSELRGIDVLPTPAGIEVHLEVSSECEWRLKERRRNLTGRTGCGLCGTDSLSMVRQTLPVLPEVMVTPAAVTHAVRALRSQQPRQQITGATHAAALCRLDDGAIVLAREDVGRHNALDKLIGAALRQGIDSRQHFIAVTSRASFEMVQKAAHAGVSVLAAVSAPTAMAVDLALEARLLLLGFVREERLVAYTFAERIVPQAALATAD
ncbi:formate dehydrogenase accessory sulfurtransferase FdhD [Hydrogenophaga palleronii]|uniref:formate dehydrogenase accessory sulfurtransferase FdhD n=1 Tax=Hydrogenophaga palleronii TaxID=65655 RepID=UPI0008255849|nr:formate dehydrogenase accessory sulfurtransferase FdhD [Hydrogenophaga palleronii]